MAAPFIEDIEESEDEDEVSYFAHGIWGPRRKNLLTLLMINGLEIVGEAGLVAYMWKNNFHPASLVIVSAFGAVSVVDLYQNAREYIRKSPTLIRDRLRLSCLLTSTVIAYFIGVHGFSSSLKSNKHLMCILCLGITTINYNLSVTSQTILGRTVMDRSPFMKCCQLLFGPSLLWSAGYYLKIFQQHDEEWLLTLPMMASAIVGGLIASAGYGRVESNNEPRWLLFKGLEIFIGGCLLLANGAALLIHGTKNQFPPVYVGLFASFIYIGFRDITNSLETFQACAEMEAPVFYSISGMIGGLSIFTSSGIFIRCLGQPNLMPVFVIMGGIGLTLFQKSVKDLDAQVRPPVFKRYCQRILGPVVTMYSSLAAAYLGYSMGWHFSLLMVPFTSAGMYATYSGFMRRNGA